MKIFGPVPSRRLGRSIGINNIPPKICSLACAYCQLGRAIKMDSTRQDFYSPEELMEEVREKVDMCVKTGEKIDYLTVVPDGEPTLDINLGRLLDLLGGTGIKTAVITNSTLMSHPAVRDELCKADLVSVKVDSADEETWRRVDHPLKSIVFEEMLEGLLEFSRVYQGRLITETMLAKGFNDSVESLEKTAGFIKKLDPHTSYISIPTRPPADEKAVPPDEERINLAYQIFSGAGVNTEYLIGYEGNRFASTGDPGADLMSITAVHPMREDAVEELLEACGETLEFAETLADEGKLVISEYNGHRYYMRKLR